MARRGFGSKRGMKRRSEDITFPVKRAPLGMCWRVLYLELDPTCNIICSIKKAL
jgi:hypothetical protein